MDSIRLKIDAIKFQIFKAHELLEEKGIGLKVIDCYSINPLDSKNLTDSFA